MKIKVEKISRSTVKILDVDGLKGAQLPDEYKGGYPRCRLLNNETGIQIQLDTEKEDTISIGEYYTKDKLKTRLNAITLCIQRLNRILKDQCEKIIEIKFNDDGSYTRKVCD